jgi:two-component sensor histidine kinase
LGGYEDNIEIEFSSIDHVSSRSYQYKIQDAIRDWRVTSQHSRRYEQLAPGRYQLVVRAIAPDGTNRAGWSAILSFRVLPPVWQRWWFVTAAAVISGLMLAWLYRYRCTRLAEVERMRVRIAADLHDDIGSSLSQIAIMSEMALHHMGGNTALAKPISGIACTSRELIDSMSDIVWAINPHRDSLRDLSQRMRRFAGDVLTVRDTELLFHIRRADQEMKLGADVRRHVLLIFKEAVNNIARHAACSRVEIEFGTEHGWLMLTLIDNGRGFEKGNPGEGHGLANMHRRAVELCGRMEVQSTPGTGTIISLCVPVDHGVLARKRGPASRFLFEPAGNRASVRRKLRGVKS